MVVDTVNEKLCVNKLISQKREVLLIEGDMIVPDSKPDILNTICTSGVVCIYKKEILDEKIRLDGNINAYIMYLADDSKDKIRAISTNLDFSEIIGMPNAKEGMNLIVESNLKNIECKVINGRKIGIKAALEVNLKLYSNEEIEIINDIQNAQNIQLLKEDLKLNSLVGMGETKIYAKDTIAIDNVDNLAEILKANICICDKDIKVSYNKILTKAEAQVKIMYLTEDNRINLVNTKIPVVGFIDIPNVTENNICDVNYEIKNLVIKPNSMEEHSIYIEIEIGVTAMVYEEKQINLIQDLYSPCEILEFNKKNIKTISNKTSQKETIQIREKVQLEGCDNKSIIDVDVRPLIENESKQNSKILYEGVLNLNFMLVDKDLQVDTRNAKIPFNYTISDIEDAQNMDSKIDIEVANQDFIIQDGSTVTSNIDLEVNRNLQKNTNLNIMDEIQTNGEREEEDYNLVMYIVKKGDTLWKIAKELGSTIDDIVRTNGIEDANLILEGQKLFIPKYTRSKVKQEEILVNKI